MARQIPQPDQMYDSSEVKAMCGFLNDDQLSDLVADGRFPVPIQQSRQSPALWVGRLLLAWLELQPSLHRRTRGEKD